MKNLALVMVAASILGVSSSFAQHKHDDRREAAAHVHGSGKLNIAIENNKVSIGLDSPAVDIVGFETAPTTPEQTAKLEKAIASLKDAGKVFTFGPDVGCTLVKAESGLEAPAPAAPPTAGAKSEQHADFAGSFEFECKSIAKLRRIDLTGFFAAFPSSGKLDITLITAKGQTTRTATKKAPRIDLAGAL